jgi:hypothetical protein
MVTQGQNYITGKKLTLPKMTEINYHNLGLGTYCGLPPVGWVHICVLFLMVFLLVSTRATWDSGIKILVCHTLGFEYKICTLLLSWPSLRRNSVRPQRDDCGGKCVTSPITRCPSLQDIRINNSTQLNTRRRRRRLRRSPTPSPAAPTRRRRIRT